MCYLDFTDDILKQTVFSSKIVPVKIYPSPPLIFPDIQNIKNAVAIIKSAKKPLIIIGKGKN